ncbi:endonuclease [Neotamlana laminarinivorans]|uniref:Endonuclease n=1 Tax=Neotamlana laminarinivorans TaxID=2883124 RepID=A0A9X1HZ06_9FLAO|nr:endonuclease [Tamlana laminarinivorans]MCB4798728.1 endonuclease [Tamlana laminarinivorans]
MKHFYFFFLLISGLSFAQLTPPTALQDYYSGVDFNKTGTDLFDDLAIPTASKHSNYLSYTPGIWNASKETDLDPTNSNSVVLIYGYSDTDGNYVTDRTRDKDETGGTAGSHWNREHTFPNSLGSPSLDSNGDNNPPYADAHNLRPSDVTMNSNRGNKKFITGSGNAQDISGSWYPGDEWKGDVARIIMYMYLRYGDQCKPSYVANGTANAIDADMINLLLDWNAEDPVSTIEDNRNTYHGNTSNTYAQGNRNPFIDNPYLATVIWGGTAAENRWGDTADPDTEAPTTPTNLTASNPTSSTVDLAWTASTDNEAVVTYNIYIDGNYYVATNSTATTFTVTGLSAETTYQFAVLAVDAASNTSTLSNSVTETTLEAPASGDNCLSETFENIPTNASNYAERTWTGDDGGTWTSTDARTDQTLNSRTICIRNGNLTAPTITGGIGSLTVTTQLTFSGSDGTFDVLVNGNSVGSIPYSGDNTSATTTTITDINIEGSISLVLDNQSTSNRVRIDDLSWTCYNGSLSTSDAIGLSNINIYPNPVSGDSISINSNENLSFEIYNMLGKLLNEGKTINKTISIQTLNSGIYILKLSNGVQSITKRLIKE